MLAALGTAGAAACAAAVVVTLSGTQSSNPALDAQVRGAIVAIPIAVGLYAWYHAHWARFGKLLVIAGFAASVATLAQSSNDVLYSAGRGFAWLVEPLLIYLVLAFPSGRLTTLSERRLVGATALLVALLYLPTMLLVDSYPSPSPWSTCDATCPPNAFMLLGSEPGFVGAVMIPFREVATISLFTGVLVVLAARIRRGTPLMRITLVPVLAFAILHGAAVIAGIATRRAIPGAAVTDVLSWVIALSFAGMGLGFMAGLWGWRLFENRALRRLVAGLAAHPPALTMSETSELLSESMDPSVAILRRPAAEADVWIDTEGRPSRLSNGAHRCVIEISTDDGQELAVVHDAALKDAPTFVGVARSSVLKALENERLGTELRKSLRELRESRARIMSSADRERQRIERDLHDGAQQSLVALRIRLDLAGELLSENPARAEQVLGELGKEVDGALDQVRSLARGVYPSLLADSGLREALHAAALRNPVQTTVDVDGIGRYSPDVEAAIYFCCLEAMQNAMKHGGGVKGIAVSLAARGDLRFEVRDDGAGFALDDAVSGAGITNMRDRLAAVGGILVIGSTPGKGTIVSGTVSLNGNGAGEASTIGRLATRTPTPLAGSR
jgi:signal transduction histidine kinase